MAFLTNIDVLDLLREPFYWKIYNADKENKKQEVWTLFEEYNILFKDQPGSKWHSKILESATFQMKESDEWRFLEFFLAWNPETLSDADWKEVKKEDKVLKSLGVKALNKSFEILKSSNPVINLAPLLKAYDIAISKYPKDNWLKREKAILLVKTGNKDQAIKIYKELIFELGGQAYIWHEFSKCVEDLSKDVAIGMLIKAITLQENEDFLGEIHLDLAQLLININLKQAALIELDKYRKNRDLNGWKFAEKYHVLFKKVDKTITETNANIDIYKEKIKIAEEFAYQEIAWTEVVLVEKWKNDKGKQKLSFTDGINIEFSISQNRFPGLHNIELGQVFSFKLHKSIITSEVSQDTFNLRRKALQYSYIPLLVQKTTKPAWSILAEINAVVDYVNGDKKIVHAITFENKEIFFQDDKLVYKINDFIKARVFRKKIKDEIRYELRDIIKIDKNLVLEEIPKRLAIVDSVNVEKGLFHFVINPNVHGVVRFEDTKLRPKEGEFISIRLLHKLDKKNNRLIYRSVEIVETNESTTELRKDIKGVLELKFKRNGRTLNFEDLSFAEDHQLPDFGFIQDFYVPKALLNRNEITSNCLVTGRALFNGSKWKVFEIIKVG